MLKLVKTGASSAQYIRHVTEQPDTDTDTARDEATYRAIVEAKTAAQGKSLTSEQLMYRNDCDAFSWCVKSMADHKQYTKLAPYMRQWWVLAFGLRPLPEGAVRANDIFRMIRYELLLRGLKKFSLPIPEVVANRYVATQLLLENRERALKMMPATTNKLFEYEELSEFGQLRITFNKVYIPIQMSNLNRGEHGYKGAKIEKIEKQGA